MIGTTFINNKRAVWEWMKLAFVQPFDLPTEYIIILLTAKANQHRANVHTQTQNIIFKYHVECKICN